VTPSEGLAFTRADVLAFIGRHRYAVLATASPNGDPQAAVVGIVVTNDFEIIFDTLESTRKAGNIGQHSRVALVIGGSGNDDQETIQLEGVADLPVGSELEEVRRQYLEKFPDGKERLRWPGILHFRVRTEWRRYSDFRGETPRVFSWSGDQLRAKG
jgi:general stress protein 26